MSQLNRKLVRDLVTHWAQVGAIVVVVALGVVMFSGPLLAQRDLRDSVNAIYRRTRYEDFSISVGSAPTGAAGRFASLDNVSAVEGRLSRDLLATVKGHELTLRVVSVPDAGRSSVNDLIVESGRYPGPGETEQCLAEHHLSTELKLQPGDAVTINNGTAEVSLRVAGTVVSPEYLRLVRSRAEYVSDPSQFGVVFMRYSEVRRLLGAGDTVNGVVARVRDKRLLDATMAGARVLMTPYDVAGLSAGSEEPSAVALDFEINDIGKLAIFFAVLLLAVASLALYITMTQIVFSQQREIGVTRALGYGGGTISRHYLGYGAVLGTAGGALGVALGYGLSRLLINVFANIFALPLIQTSFNVWIAVVGVGVGVAFATAGALVPARHAVRMKPAEAMRIEAGLALSHLPHTNQAGLLRALGAPAWLRLSLRNLLRNRRRTLLTCLGVIGTVCLLVSATGGKDSLDHSVDKYLNGVLRWDVGAQWQGVTGAEALETVRGMEGVSTAEPLIDAPALIVFAGRSSDLQVQAYQRDSVLHGSYPTRGSKAQPGPGEVLLNRGIKTRLPVRIGDTVTLSTALGRLPLRVAGFVSEPFGGVCYVNLEYVQSVARTATGVPDAFNAVVVKTKPGRTAAVAGALREVSGVSQVLTKAGIMNVFDELIGAVRTLFLIFYVMAFAMGFATLFSMTTVNLLERSREAATIRTLGAGKSRIFSFVTVENLVVVLAALIPGFLLGRLLEWVVMEKLLISERLAPDAVISTVTLLGIVAASLVVVVLSELPSIVRLWHLDLARVTKERAD